MTEIRDDAGGHVGTIDDKIIHAAIVQAVEEDRRNRRLSIRAAYTLIGVGLAVLLLAVYIQQNKIQDQVARARELSVSIQKEGAERRSQNCTTFEGAHRQEVDRLNQTYAYILKLTPAERRTTLNRTVIAGVPRLETEASSDSDNEGVLVPSYCDEPGVGLPEPDPIVPKRPAKLKKILPPQQVLRSSFDPKPRGG